MDKSGRVFLGIIIAFIIIGAGLAAGFYIRFKLPDVTTVAKLNTPPPPNHNTYDISPPSRGAAIEKFSIDITPLGNAGFVTLSADEAAAVKTGQKIILYDKNGAMLETLGEITKITETGNSQIIVHFNLNGDETLSVADVKKGDIVISKNPMASRLPLTALIRNEKGQTYIWEAHENEDGTYTAYFKPAPVVQNTYEYFVLDYMPGSSGVYILNPDEKLEDGQKINTNKILYSAPGQTDDQRMEVLMLARQTRLKNERDRRIAEEHARLGLESSGEASANSCNITDDFLKTIKSLSQKTSQPSSDLPATSP